MDPLPTLKERDQGIHLIGPGIMSIPPSNSESPENGHNAPEDEDLSIVDENDQDVLATPSSDITKH